MRTRRSERSLLAFFLVALILAGAAVWLRPRHASNQSLVLTKEQARAINADMPYADGPVTPARHYAFHGSDRARRDAVDCLATAALYEAGRDAQSQRAVIQVILNRVRSPGFPKTVCGVVYQGYSRVTGCQFSFTCDRSLTRRPERFGWAGARSRARQALGGRVYAPVGTATHYHTDWVVPAWSASMDKLAKVRTHIFYRVSRRGA